MDLVWHFFSNAEIYAIALAWVVIPLAYYACFLFFQRQYGLFQVHVVESNSESSAPTSLIPHAPSTDEGKKEEGAAHGAS